MYHKKPITHNPPSFYMFILLIVASLFSACKKDEPTIVGTWALTKTEYWQAGKLTGQNQSTNATWQFTPTSMAIMQDGLTDTYDIKISGSTISPIVGLPFTIVYLDHYNLQLSKSGNSDIEMHYFFER